MLTHNYKAEEMWIANKQQIIRVTVSSWQQIYEEMSHTENIQLLKFLVLLKTMSSPLIRKPNRFDGLDYFFPDHSAEAQKILLEYYQVMGLTPSLEEIRKSPRLLVPFILQHQIDNLSESVKEFLTGYWLEKDERLVEEMIIGGSSYGWEIAVSKGWVRAFKAMVEQGMELELPVIKLSSMMIAEMKIVFETDQLGFGTDQLGFDTDQLGFETDKSSSRLMTEKSDRKK